MTYTRCMFNNLIGFPTLKEKFTNQDLVFKVVRSCCCNHLMVPRAQTLNKINKFKRLAMYWTYSLSSAGLHCEMTSGCVHPQKVYMVPCPVLPPPPPPPMVWVPPPLPPYLMHFAHATVAKLTFPYFCMHAAVAKRTFSFCWMNPLAGFGGSIARNCGEMQILSSKNGSAQCTGHFNAQQMESYTYTYPCTYIFITSIVTYVKIYTYIYIFIYVHIHIHIDIFIYT